MKEDIKNVVITFGLIATALFSGSFVYQKKVESEYLLAVKQEQLQSLINEQQVVLDQLSQQAVAKSVPVTKIVPVQTQISTPTQPAKSKSVPVVKPKAVAAPPSPPSQPVVQPSPVVKAPTPAPVPPKSPVVVKPTRKSKAS